MNAIFFVAVILLQVVFSSATFSISFHAGTGNQAVRLLNVGAKFVGTPSVEHVADLYSRLSGMAPLMWEGEK
jgi:hypothetical protein